MTIDLGVFIGIVVPLASLCVAYLAYRHNMKKYQDECRKVASEEGRSDGIILTQLGYMQSTLDDIKQEQRQAGKQHAELVKEVSMMQRDLKTAFSRIDDNRKGIDEVKKDIRAYHQN